MKSHKTILIVIFIQYLTGCASTSSRQCVASYIDKEIFKNHKTSIVKENIESDIVVEDNIPQSEFSGIESAELNESMLKLNFVNRDYIEKYTAPRVNIIEKTEYEAHPIGGTIGGVGLLLFLFRPETQTDWTLGCYEEKYLNKEPNLDKKVSIGYRWKDTEKAHKILIKGFDREYEYITTYNYNGHNYVDLKSAIINTNFSKNTTLTISCIDCKEQNNFDQSNFNYAQSTIKLNYDFRNLKQNLLLAEEKKKIEKNKQEKINIELEKIKLRAEKIKQGGVPLDEFENKCIALDFKKGTKDFGDCVLKLNEIK